METPILRAIESFAVGNRVIGRGNLVPADDPVVEGRAHLFEPVEAAIERATRRPGERRTTPTAQPAQDAPSGDEKPADADTPSDPTTVPERAEDVVAWIGDDPARAQAALDAEATRDKPRTTVIDKATAVLGAG